MATSYLSLTTSLSGSTYFSDYLSAQDSNWQTIDTFARNTALSISTVSSAALGAYGVLGSFTLLSSSWISSQYQISIAELGANDFIFIKGASRADISALALAEVIANASTGVVTLEALNTPDVDITIKYGITRGSANG